MNLQNSGYPCKVTIGTKAHPTDPVTEQFAHAFSIAKRRVEQDGYKLPSSCCNSANFRATVWLFACRCIVCHTEVYRICEVPSDHQNVWYKPANLAMEQYRDEPFVCPICGKSYRYIGYDFSEERLTAVELREFNSSKNYDRMIKRALGSVVDSAYIDVRESVENAVKHFVKSVDVPQATHIPSVTIEAIKSDPEQLKQYLFQLIQLECNIYALLSRLPDTYYLQKFNGLLAESSKYAFSQKVKGKTPSQNTQMANQLKDVVKQLENDYAYWQAEISRRSKEKVIVSKIARPKEPTPPVLGVPGFFNKKKILAENEVLTAKYNEDMAAYNLAMTRWQEENTRLRNAAETEKQAQIEEAQQSAESAKIKLEEAKRQLVIVETSAKTEAAANQKKIDEQLRQFTSPESVVQDMLEQEVQQTEKLLQKAFITRNELYAANIVFKKYRTPVALSSFYEYLMAGRCTKLEGADGAYNLYEAEVRANRVIEQLDTVIDSLEQIKANQYMMYSTMCDMRDELGELNSSMGSALDVLYDIEGNTAKAKGHLEAIAQSNEVIAYNTAAAAYYAKKNAELTNALGYLVALK